LAARFAPVLRRPAGAPPVVRLAAALRVVFFLPTAPLTPLAALAFRRAGRFDWAAPVEREVVLAGVFFALVAMTFSVPS